MVAALKAEPDSFDIGVPTGIRAWAKMVARRSQTAAMKGRCRAEAIVAVSCRSMLWM